MTSNPYESPAPAPSTNPFADLAPQPTVDKRIEQPATLLLAIATLTAGMHLLGGGMNVYTLHASGELSTSEILTTVAGNIICFLFNLFIAFGALRALQFRSLPWVRAAAIMSLLPLLTPCVLLGIPFGIWILVLLRKPEVRAAFR